MELVDVLHQNNIGVIMDFVPVHFALDGYGLARYDGTPLYEHPTNDVGYSEWGSMNFIHSKVRCQASYRVQLTTGLRSIILMVSEWTP